MRRSILENALTSYLTAYGWEAPSLRVQAAAFPGATPAQSSEGGKGRGGIVFDLERRGSGNILISHCLGLKATSNGRPDTLAITTGTEEHCENIVKACHAGLDVPIVAVRVIDAEMDGEDLVGFSGIEATCVRFGAKLRAHGIVQRTTGQGKGRGVAAPVAWGKKAQKAASGKIYSYVTLQANVAACLATWETLRDLRDLERYVSEHAEGIIL